MEASRAFSTVVTYWEEAERASGAVKSLEYGFLGYPICTTDPAHLIFSQLQNL